MHWVLYGQSPEYLMALIHTWSLERETGMAFICLSRARIKNLNVTSWRRILRYLKNCFLEGALNEKNGEKHSTSQLKQLQYS